MNIYDSIGGVPAVRAAVDDFYTRVLADARLATFFTGTDLDRLKAHQRAFIAAASRLGATSADGNREHAGGCPAARVTGDLTTGAP